MVKGHVPSAATKAKISMSLKGNKNAFRGGPKKPLSTRQKVANINAAAKKKQFNLSPDQLERRRKVAQRLRGIARKEEAGITPAHSKPIPHANGPDPEHAQADAIEKATIKGSFAKQPGANNKAPARAESPTSEFKEPFPTARAGESKSAYSIRLAQYNNKRDAAARTQVQSTKSSSRANPPVPHLNKRNDSPAPLKQNTGGKSNDIMNNINNAKDSKEAERLIDEYNKQNGIKDEAPLPRRPGKMATKIPKSTKKVSKPTADAGSSVSHTEPFPMPTLGESKSAYQIRLAGYNKRKDAATRGKR